MKLIFIEFLILFNIIDIVFSNSKNAIIGEEDIWADLGGPLIQRYRRMFNRTLAIEETKFWLYNRYHQENGFQIIQGNRTSFEEAKFNPKLPIRFLVHGFLTKRSDSPFEKNTKEAYLSVRYTNLNVISVDWGKLSGDFILSEKILLQRYFNKTKSVHHIGTVLKNFAQYLNETYKVPYDRMYIIGHSLGAHIAGYAGRFLYESTSHKFNTIFALDPAGPIYKDLKEEDRIDKSDAHYVESIHTNSAEYGIKDPAGHASFYPDFGKLQPGCLNELIPKLPCSHERSYKYFADSLLKPFYAKKCSSINEIYKERCTQDTLNVVYETMGGEPSNPNKRGVFYSKMNGTTETTIYPIFTINYLLLRLFHNDENLGNSSVRIEQGSPKFTNQTFYPGNTTIFFCIRNCKAARLNLNRTYANILQVKLFLRNRAIFDDDFGRIGVRFAKLLEPHLDTKSPNITFTGIQEIVEFANKFASKL